MASDVKRYTVTSALPYANGPLHIGQIAGAYLPADIFVRFLRLKQRNVVYICGSDEHGVAITLKAIRENTTSREIVDRFHTLNEESFKRFGISFDVYHRTSDPTHHQTAQDFFTTLYDKGEFDEIESEQYFDEENQLFLADRYIVGTCPNCGNEDAYGDQCENCGTSLSPKELKDPRSTISGNEPVLKKTKHWFLPMDKYEPWLKDWILKDHTEWKRNVYGQCKSWLEQGLRPRAMTRDLDWGVPVPLPGNEGKVLYVWMDAPIGYISATKAWAEKTGKDWKPYWQDEESALYHFIGKDNIVFHCIIFPIILKAHGDYILPTNVPANEFMNMEGEKISTSRNWAVWLHEYLYDLAGKQDELRYVLAANMPETKDSEFTWNDFQEKVNSELVGILGNFINRVWVLQHKYFEGIVQPGIGSGTNEGLDLEWGTDGFPNKIAKSIELFRFREALNSLMDVARAGNKFLTEREPWNKYKSDPQEVGQILNACVQIIANLSIVMEPFLPHAAEKVLKMLNVESGNWKWEDAGRLNLIADGHQLNAPKLLFEKIEDSLVKEQKDKLLASRIDPEEPEEPKGTPIKEEISFDQFTAMDIRVGEIKEAIKVEKADKLLQLKVDIGIEERIILSGIAEYFKPEELIGKKVSVLVNLKPRKIRGIMSQGMILLGEDGNGLKFVVPEGSLENGSEIR